VRIEMTGPILAFDGKDELAAHASWGCNCGPAALAACLGWTLDAVRPHLGDFESRGYMSPTMMALAVAEAGFVHRRTKPGKLPLHGLARIQWGGPWLLPGVPARAAYRYTHWIAVKQIEGSAWVFDVNHVAWQPLDSWRHGTATVLLANVKRGDGTYSFSHCWEIRNEAPKRRKQAGAAG
jgi:hypothetical protein